METNYCKVMYKFLNWQLTGERTWRKLCEFWACSLSWSGWWFYISVSIPGLPWWLRWVNNPTASAGDVGLIPGSGRSPGAGNSNPLPYSCLGNPKDRGAWQAVVHGVARVGHNLATKQQHIYVYYRHIMPSSSNISNILFNHEKGGFLPSATT